MLLRKPEAQSEIPAYGPASQQKRTNYNYNVHSETFCNKASLNDIFVFSPVFYEEVPLQHQLKFLAKSISSRIFRNVIPRERRILVHLSKNIGVVIESERHGAIVLPSTLTKQ
jgi:hypothetical protein